MKAHPEGLAALDDDDRQTTLARSFVLEGIGLHSGRRTRVRVAPAPVDHGLRIATGTRPPVQVSAWTVTDTRLGTTLGAGSSSIRTVEHWLAALAGLGIDNAYLYLDGRTSPVLDGSAVPSEGVEFPILDGSALPVVEAILNRGRRRQDKARRYAVVCRSVEVRGPGHAWARLEPYAACRLEGDYSFRAPIGRQRMQFDMTESTFIERLAPARTFGFTEDIERLRRSGRALGGSLHNAVVFDASGVVNAEGLRDPSEVALHKLLDAWGDLSLFGMPWRGRYIGHRSGHALNVALVMRALTTKGAVRIESPAPLRVFREKAVAS